MYFKSMVLKCVGTGNHIDFLCAENALGEIS